MVLLNLTSVKDILLLTPLYIKIFQIVKQIFFPYPGTVQGVFPALKHARFGLNIYTPMSI